MLQTAYTHTKTRLNLTPWRNSPHLLTVFEMNEALMSRQGVTTIHAFHEEAKWFFLKMLSDKLVCSCQHDMKDTHYKQLELQTRPPWYHIPHSWLHAAWENQTCPFICLNEAHCIITRKSFKTRKRLLQFFTSTQRRASIERAESSTLLKDALRLYIQSHKAGCLGPRGKIHNEWTYTAKLVNAHNCYLYSNITRLFTITNQANWCCFTTGYFAIS